MIETLLTLVLILGMVWLFNRPLDDEYKAALIMYSEGNREAETLVAEFLQSKRPTSYQAAFLLKKIKRLKIKQSAKKM